MNFDPIRLLDPLDEDYAKRKEILAQRNRNYSFVTRDDRSRRAKDFVDMYGESHIDYPVIRACTWLAAERLWNDKWLGMTWVALHGIDSLCVVVLKKDLVQLELKVSPNSTDYFLLYYWNAIVNEVEGIQDCMFGGSCKRPFSVVSVISGTSHEASRAEYCARKISKFLQEEMKSSTTFTLDKTMQTAISAFQHLFSREFKANEIRAFARKDGDIVGKELPQWCEDMDLEELLASINEPDNGPDKFSPKKDGTLLEGGLQSCSREGKDGTLLEGGLQRCSKEGKDGTLLEGGLQRCSREGQGDGSSWLSGKSKASENATHPKEVRESRVQRRQLRTKVRKLSSMKATEEKGDAHDSVTWWQI